MDTFGVYMIRNAVLIVFVAKDYRRIQTSLHSIQTDGACWTTSSQAKRDRRCPMHDATRTLADFSDKELADMIRNGCYSRNTRFGFGPDDARFLLVLAVPYGRDEDVETLTEALDGFLRFCSDD